MKANGFIINRILVWIFYLTAIGLLSSAIWLLLTSFSDRQVRILMIAGFAALVFGMLAKLAVKKSGEREYLRLQAEEEAESARLAKEAKRAAIERERLERERMDAELEQLRSEEAKLGIGPAHNRPQERGSDSRAVWG